MKVADFNLSLDVVCVSRISVLFFLIVLEVINNSNNNSASSAVISINEHLRMSVHLVHV
jgi:hypothetical protein